MPEDARALEIDFEHLSPVGSARGRRAMSRDLVNLDWTKLLLYPAGHWLSAIRVKPTVTLPAGFEAATSLRPLSGATTLAFDEVSLEMLIDSPLSPAVTTGPCRSIPRARRDR